MRVARWMRPLLALCGMGRRSRRIVLTDSSLEVRAGVWFRLRVARDTVRHVGRERDTWWAIGVHTDLRRTWVVNGSPRGMVSVQFDPPARGRMAGIPIHVRRLLLSVTERDEFLAEWPADVRG
jgi:hypothetical protein